MVSIFEHLKQLKKNIHAGSNFTEHLQKRNFTQVFDQDPVVLNEKREFPQPTGETYVQ